MQIVMDAIVAARTIRTEHEVHPGAEIPVVLRSASAEIRELLTSRIVGIRTLIKTQGDPPVEPAGAERPKGSVMSASTRHRRRWWPRRARTSRTSSASACSSMMR